MLKANLLLSVFLIPVSAFAQIDSLFVLPGEGIIVHADTILINDTPIEESMSLLGISELPPLIYGIADGWDLETGESISNTFVAIKLNYFGIIFEYEGDIENELNLKWIRIPKSEKYSASIANGLFLGQINPPIDSFFPEVSKYDYVSEDSLTYNLYSYGISFSLKGEEEKILNEISVHYTIEEP